MPFLVVLLVLGICLFLLWATVTVVRRAWKGGSVATEKRVDAIEDEIVELKVQLRVLSERVRTFEKRP